ncbi:MAG: hypothetical protein QF824_05865 [Candidatus Woesearchaeota archaeon]|nr:hypothetical protein [Candidatus Woesearchaeota archaeon]
MLSILVRDFDDLKHHLKTADTVIADIRQRSRSTVTIKKVRVSKAA